MRINQNIAAFNAYRNLTNTQSQQASSLEKLSSGFRINRAADDASGLVNSENLRSQIGGLKVATRNAQDAISLVQTAEGAQTEVHSILQRMRDLTVQSGNLGTNDAAALKANQDEITELAAELDRIAEQTQFGTKRILDGTFEVTPETAATGTLGAVAEAPGDFGTTSLDFDITVDGGTVQNISLGGEYTTRDELLTALNGAVNGASFSLDDANNLVVTSDTAGDSSSVLIANTAGAGGSGVTDLALVEGDAEQGEGAMFQVGANATQQVQVGIAGVSSAGLGVNAIDVTTNDIADIDSALTAIDNAIGTVSENRATLGAFQNRMESTIRNVGVAVENLSAAESRIRDTDMAQEMVEFTRSQILSQAGTAMLAQANMVPQSVLSLLG